MSLKVQTANAARRVIQLEFERMTRIHGERGFTQLDLYKELRKQPGFDLAFATVQMRLRELDLHTNSKGSDSWSDKDKDFVCNNMEVMTKKDIGRQLGRSEAAVHALILRLRQAGLVEGSSVTRRSESNLLAYEELEKSLRIELGLMDKEILPPSK